VQGVVKVAAVDVDTHKELGGRYGIKGFPTIKIFGADKNSPENYEGPRTSKGLIEAALSAIRRKVDLQSGGSRSSGGSGSGGSGKSEVCIGTCQRFNQNLWLPYLSVYKPHPAFQRARFEPSPIGHVQKCLCV